MRTPWRWLADWCLADVDWRWIGHSWYVMTWPMLSDPPGLRTVAGYVSISDSLWRSHNGGWRNARAWPSLDEIIAKQLLFLYQPHPDRVTFGSVEDRQTVPWSTQDWSYLADVERDPSEADRPIR